MRIAYDNLIKTATCSATNENANYPIENIYSAWRKQVFKSTSRTSTITINFSEASTLTCIALSYHNLDLCTISVINSEGTTLGELTLDTDYETTSAYCDYSDVLSLEIYAHSYDDILQIGVLFGGDSIYTTAESDQEIPLTSSDSPVFSNDYQVAGRKGSTVRTAEITIPLLTYTERKEIEECYKECGLTTPFFLDLWDSSHDSFEPLYCVFTDDLTVTHYHKYDEITMTIQEVN